MRYAHETMRPPIWYFKSNLLSIISQIEIISAQLLLGYDYWLQSSQNYYFTTNFEKWIGAPCVCMHLLVWIDLNLSFLLDILGGMLFSSSVMWKERHDIVHMGIELSLGWINWSTQPLMHFFCFSVTRGMQKKYCSVSKLRRCEHWKVCGRIGGSSSITFLTLCFLSDYLLLVCDKQI